MRIRKIKLRNFKCFGPAETSIDLYDMSAIIGSNNSGKTVVLLALQRMFGISNKERTIIRSDFHVPKGVLAENIMSTDLMIEVIIDFNELEEKRIDSTSVPEFFDRMTIDFPGGSPYIRLRLEATWKESNSPEGEIESKIYFIEVPENDELENDSESKRVMPLHYRSLIQLQYVPAIREPVKQLKNVSGTILWRILNGINWKEDDKINISNGLKAVNESLGGIDAVKKIQETMSSHWKSYHKDSRYSDARFSFNTTEMDAILKKLEIEFIPTEIPGSYTIEYLGEGLRSLFYFTLVNVLLEIEEHALKESMKKQRLFNMTPPILTILAVEEPENHISPHILGKVINNIKSISEKSNAQVVLTSHAPSIVKRVDPESICHLRIESSNHSTVASKVLLPDKQEESYKFVKEAVIAYPELYFSRLVILGEGDTECIVLPKLIEAFGDKIDASGISIVPLGGRHVNHFWRLLNNINIPYITLLDLDLGRHGGGWGRIKYCINELISSGMNKSQLLKKKDKQYSDRDLDKMHTWKLDTSSDSETAIKWAEDLGKYNVIYSYPLDIDFALLNAFKDEYKAIVPESGGPRIPSDPKERKAYIEKATQATLKEGNDKIYSKAEKELMIWYNYLFLYRGKPSTHLLALNNIEKNKLKANFPDFLKNTIELIKKKLKDDPFSSIGKQK